MRRIVAFGLAAVLLLLSAPLVGGAATDDFDHEQHRKLFPTCSSCHAGVTDPGRPVMPSAASCASCHDGQIEEAVSWKPRTAAWPSNLRFTHGEHQAAVREDLGDGLEPGLRRLPHAGRQGLDDRAAHRDRPVPRLPWPEGGTPRSARHRLRHLPPDPRRGHHPAAGTGCRLQGAVVPRGRGVRHSERDMGKLAAPPGGTAFQVAPSCATCHARDFCAACHVNAPEVKLIQALAPDVRSLAHKAELEAPANHSEARFLARHGAESRRDITACATCHTAESCVACHRSTPAVARLLPAAGPGRGGRGGASCGRGPQATIPASPTATALWRAPPRPAAAPATPGPSAWTVTGPTPAVQRRLPPGRLSHPPSRRGLQPAVGLHRMPQSGRVLRLLPRAGRASLHRHHRPRVPRCRERVPRGTWRRGPAVHRELRDLPHRAGLPAVSLRPGGPPLQPARPGLRPRAAPPAQPADLRRLPRAGDSLRRRLGAVTAPPRRLAPTERQRGRTR